MQLTNKKLNENIKFIIFTCNTKTACWSGVYSNSNKQALSVSHIWSSTKLSLNNGSLSSPINCKLQILFNNYEN